MGFWKNPLLSCKNSIMRLPEKRAINLNFKSVSLHLNNTKETNFRVGLNSALYLSISTKVEISNVYKQDILK